MENRPYTVSELTSDPSFIRWAEGHSDAEEARQWDQWVKASERNRHIALKARQIVSGFSFEDPDLSHIEEDWQGIRYRISQSQPDTPSLYNSGSKRTDAFALFLKVAALLLIISSAGLFLYLYQDPEAVAEEVPVHSIETGFEEKKTIRLSDGSTVILAAGSRLSYKGNWLSQPVKRLNLEGEAYFSITPEKSGGHPKFVVETADGTVAVWGTKFTVDTYGEGTEVVLQEGEVKVGITGLNEQREVALKPGDMVRFRKSIQEIVRKKVKPRVYTSWISDQLFFDDTPLSVLIDRIQRTYGVEVAVESPHLLDIKLSGAVDFRGLDSLISSVSEVLDIQISRFGSKVIIKKNTNN